MMNKLQPQKQALNIRNQLKARVWALWILTGHRAQWVKKQTVETNRFNQEDYQTIKANNCKPQMMEVQGIESHSIK